MVSEAHDQKRLTGKVPRESGSKPLVVPRAHPLASQVFVDLRIVAEGTPVGRKLRHVATCPWEMVGCRVDEHEHRSIQALPGKKPAGCVVVEAVRLVLE